jgi:hypothetical protein
MWGIVTKISAELLWHYVFDLVHASSDFSTFLKGNIIGKASIEINTDFEKTMIKVQKVRHFVKFIYVHMVLFYAEIRLLKVEAHKWQVSKYSYSDVPILLELVKPIQKSFGTHQLKLIQWNKNIKTICSHIK